MTDTNWALASEGATLTGLNNYGSGLGTPYDITWANSGGIPRYDGVSSNNWPPDTPGSLAVTFAASQVISSVVLWFADFDIRDTDPGPTDTGNFVASDFTISTWNGVGWDVRATVTGNTYLTRTITIPDVDTTKIKFEWTADAGNYYIALQEIEAYGPAVPTGRSYGTSTASAVGYWDVVNATGSAAGSSTAGARGNSTGVFPLVTWDAANKHSSVNISDGGFTAAFPTGGGYLVRATKYRYTGRYYFEIECYGYNCYVGLADAGQGLQGAVVPKVNPFNTGTWNYSSGYGYSLSGDYTGDKFQPHLFRFAVDFDASRIWIGDQNGWRYNGGGYSPNLNPDAQYSNSTFSQYEQLLLSMTPMAPAFSNSQTLSGQRAILRAAFPHFRYPVPAGFMPWDDYLNDSISAWNASSVAVVSGFSNYGVAAAAGSGAAQGAGQVLVEIVGSAVGTSDALAQEAHAIAAASGIATAEARTNHGIGGALGESTALATGLRARAGAGSAAGIAVPYVHSPMREINKAQSANADNSPYVGSDYRLNDGHTIYDGVLDGSNTKLANFYGHQGALEARLTWTTNQILNGIAIYSSRWCDVYFIGSNPTGDETFPPNMGGAVTIQVQYDTTGTGMWADVLPLITGNDKIRREIIFPNWITTKAVRVNVTSDSNYIRIQELQAFTPVVVTVLEVEDGAVASDSVIAVHTLEFESSADAASTVIEKGYAILHDGGNATSSAEGIGTEKAVGSAAGTSSAKSYTILSETLVDGGVASDLVTFSRSLAVQSEGVLSTSLSGKVTHNEVSSGTASDKIEGENVITRTEESTGQATDTVIGIRRVTVVEISGGIGNNASTSSGHAQVELKSSGVASSQAVHRSVQTLTIESFGFADETLPAPFQGSFPVFWTNSVSTGAATWEGLPFNSFIEADGVVYAAGPNGIFELGAGLDDVDADVPSEIEWDLVDQGSVQMKRMRSIYVNAKSASPFTVRIANEQGMFEYVTETADTTTVTNHRAAVGRGIVSRQARVSLLHTKAYTAENAGIGMLESTRRI